MSAPDPPDPLPGGAEARAAEYVLGLLDPQEARSFESEMARAPDLRQDVSAWSEYLSTLSETIAPAAPDPALKARILAAVLAEPRTGLWPQLRPYLLGAVAAAGLAWAALALGLLNPTQQPVWQGYLAETGGSGLAFHALYDPATETLRLRRLAGPGAAAGGRTLWLIEGDASPRLIGALHPDNDTALPLPADLAGRLQDATLAIRQTPQGGESVGTVVAAGRVDKSP